MRSASAAWPAPQSALAVLRADVEVAVRAERRVGHHEVHRELGVRAGSRRRCASTICPDRGEPLVGQERVRRHDRHRSEAGATPRLDAMSRLTRADVEHVAQLARLALTDDEIEQLHRASSG